MDPTDLPDGLTLLEHTQRLEEKMRHDAEERTARMEAQQAEQEAQTQRLGALVAEQQARPPLKPEDLDTTVAQVRRMVQRDVHPDLDARRLRGSGRAYG